MIRPRGEGEEKVEEEREEGGGTTGCRPHPVSMGEVVPMVFKYPVRWIHQDEQSSCARDAQK